MGYGQIGVLSTIVRKLVVEEFRRGLEPAQIQSLNMEDLIVQEKGRVTVSYVTGILAELHDHLVNVEQIHCCVQSYVTEFYIVNI